jgi:hypothetical protein
MRCALTLLLLAIALPATAQERPLPHERPAAAGQQTEAAAPAETPPLPRTRPAEEVEAAPAEGEDAAPEEAAAAPAEPVEPPEPARVYQTACPAVVAGLVQAEMLPPLVEGACGARSPLMVSGVMANGRLVPLSSPATLNCAMATTLPDWAAAVDNYVWARENTRIARILTGTSFMCRGRNRAAGADTSEHGFANALDVTGFELEDGRSLTLPGDWADALSTGGRLLRFAHDAACARFTTTLGPEANALHADHLHFDMGCHGARCTARLCE